MGHCSDILVIRTMPRLETVSVTDAVIARLVSMISSGEVKAGQRLVPQRTLAKELGVSLSSLREATRGLAVMGLLDIQQGRGTFVTDDLTALVGKQLELGLLIGRKGEVHLLEARQILEEAIVGLAAKRATSDEISEMESLCRQMEEAVCQRNTDGLEELDMAFHLKLANACHNVALVFMARSVRHLLEHLVRATPYTAENVKQHIRVFEAVRDRDSDEARRAMDELISTTRLLLELNEGDE